MLPQYSGLDSKFFEYANDILSGAIPSNSNIKMACQRYMDWFDRTDIEFRPGRVMEKVNFVSNMKHWDGPYAGKYFKLLPWQFWIFCNLFGWYYRESKKRVARNAFIFMARKNGKAIDINTNIPTPYGSKQLRDIHVGDYIYGADGKPTKVLYESEIQYRPCYKMIFENGEELISADNHRWLVKYKNDKKSDNLVVKTTQEMYDKGIYHKRKVSKNYRTLKKSSNI